MLCEYINNLKCLSLIWIWSACFSRIWRIQPRLTWSEKYPCNYYSFLALLDLIVASATMSTAVHNHRMKPDGKSRFSVNNLTVNSKRIFLKTWEREGVCAPVKASLVRNHGGVAVIGGLWASFSPVSTVGSKASSLHVHPEERKISFFLIFQHYLNK